MLTLLRYFLSVRTNGRQSYVLKVCDIVRTNDSRTYVRRNF